MSLHLHIQTNNNYKKQTNKQITLTIRTRNICEQRKATNITIQKLKEVTKRQDLYKR